MVLLGICDFPNKNVHLGYLELSVFTRFVILDGALVDPMWSNCTKFLIKVMSYLIMVT